MVEATLYQISPSKKQTNKQTNKQKHQKDKNNNISIYNVQLKTYLKRRICWSMAYGHPLRFIQSHIHSKFMDEQDKTPVQRCMGNLSLEEVHLKTSSLCKLVLNRNNR